VTKTTIPLAVPALGGNEWKYVRECLETNWVSYQGPFVDRFERELAARCGAARAVATSSGTAALHVALLLAGVERETEVVMPGLTFVAPANAVRYCGAWPTLVDLRESDWQIDVDRLADFLAAGCERRSAGLYNRATGRRIAALMPVHLLGDLADVDALAELAARYDLPLVEDAAECIGASYKGRPIAAPATAIDAARRFVATSFNGNKTITTGGGGAILSNDAAAAARAKHLTTTAKTDPLEFFHDEVGYNYRMTNLAAALGVAQLERLDGHVEYKRQVASRYHRAFEADGRIRVHPESAHARSIFWLYTVMLDRPSLPIVKALNEAGVGARPVWTPIHRLPAFAGHCHVQGVEFTERLHRHALSLPCSVGIADADVATVAAELKRLLDDR